MTKSTKNIAPIEESKNLSEKGSKKLSEKKDKNLSEEINIKPVRTAFEMWSGK